MSSIPQEFWARELHNDVEIKLVTLRFEMSKAKYPYDLHTSNHYVENHYAGEDREINFFFHFKTGSVLVATNIKTGRGNSYKCFKLNFWINNNLPVLCTKVMFGQDYIMEHIADTFKDKYASYLIDKAINGG